MDKPIEIIIRPVPFTVYLVLVAIGGYMISEQRYIIGTVIFISLFLLLSLKRSYKIIFGVNEIQLSISAFGVALKKEELYISDYEYIRNRVQFNGIRTSGNTCVTELVGKNGNVLKLREINIGFTNTIPPDTEIFINKVVKLTNINRGANLVENP